MHGFADLGHPAGEGSGVVAGEGPESAAAREVAACAGDEGWDKGEDEQSQSASTGAGCLVVDGRQGEGAVAVENVIEVVDRIEERDHVWNGCQEPRHHLRQDGLGDILAWATVCKSGERPMLSERTYLGISSAMWEVTSAVPQLYAPFNIPRTKTKLSLE